MKIEMKVVEIPIENITPYWRNPRNNDKTIIKLSGLIERFGFNQPLVVDKNNVIIKGHSRYHACKKLGFNTIPCVVSESSDEQNNKDRITDNAISELSNWNYDRLLEELEDNSIDLVGYTVKDKAEAKEVAKKTVESSVPVGSPEVKRVENKDVIMRYMCPSCKKEILISRREALNK